MLVVKVLVTMILTLSLASALAPLESSSVTISTLPSPAALCNGVHPHYDIHG